MSDLEEQLRSYFQAIDVDADAAPSDPSSLIHVTTIKELPMSRRNGLIAAAAALVLLIGGIAVFASSDDDSVVESVDLPVPEESTTTSTPPAQEDDAVVTPTTEASVDQLEQAEEIMDAVLSLDPARLEGLDLPEVTLDDLTYWQLYSDAVGISSVTRSLCEQTSPTTTSCRFTYIDDLVQLAAAETTLVEESFIIVVGADGDVAAVRHRPSSPPAVTTAIADSRETHPEVWDGPCSNWFAGGSTPAECGKALVEIFRDN